MSLPVINLLNHPTKSFIMKYYLVNGNIELMRSSFFIYRQKIRSDHDSIVALVEDEYATEKDLDDATKKLLLLEGEFRTKYALWCDPPINLESRFLPSYSL